MIVDSLKLVAWNILHLHWLLRAVFTLADAIVWMMTIQGPRALVRRFNSPPLESVPVAEKDESTRRRCESEKTRRDTLNVARYATVSELVYASMDKHALLNAFGSREPLGMHRPPFGRSGDPELPIFGSTAWCSYANLKQKTKAFGRGLRTVGFEPLPLASSKTITTSPFAKLNGPHCLFILEDNCQEWMIAALGAMACALPVATASPSGLADDGIIKYINDTNAPGIVCNYNDVARVSRVAGSCPSLKSIIYTRANVPKTYPSLNKRLSRGRSQSPVEILEFDDIMTRGGFSSLDLQPLEMSEASELTPVTSDQLCMIVHTSGATTGTPKGVMLTHRAVLAGVRAMFQSCLDGHLQTEPHQEVYLSVTPLSHIMEFNLQLAMLAFGAAIAFSDPRSMFKATHRHIPSDGALVLDGASGMEEFKPTVVFATPATWHHLRRDCLRTIEAMPSAPKAQVQAALVTETAALRGGRNSTLCSFVLRDLKNRYAGGRVKLCLSGGSALDADLQSFVRAILGGVPFLQIYGLTEGGGGACAQLPESLHENTGVGPPMVGIEVRLSSCLDSQGGGTVHDAAGAPYLVTDKTHPMGLWGGEACLGRGEVCVRGLPVASGYYLATANYTNQRPEDDSLPVFGSDGWVRTGDVGIWTTHGQLKIVDRLKNLVKLKNGEYVAISVMEECFKQSAFVSNRNGGIMVYADSETVKPVALVQASEYDLKRWADESGEGYLSFEELCMNPRVVAMVTEDLNALGQGTFRSGSGASRNLVPAPWAANVYMNTRLPLLSSHEKLATVALIPASWDASAEGQNVPWTVENGLLTKQGTLNRKHIEKRFEDVLTVAKARAK